MSDETKYFRRTVNVDLENGTCRLLAGDFCSSAVTSVVYIDPATLLGNSEHIQGVKRAAIGKKLQDYRFNKMFQRSKDYPISMPMSGYEAKYDNDGNATGGKLILFDAPLVRELLDRGAYEIPLMVIGERDEFEEFFANLDSSKEIVGLDSLGLDIDESSTDKLPPKDEYSQFMSIYELQESIDSHVRMMDGPSFSGESDFYKSFPSNQEGLDMLIMMGAPGATVNGYWKGEAIYEGIISEIKKRKNLLEVEEINPIELVDRFSMLYERYLAYTDKQSWEKMIEQTSEERIDKLSKVIAAKFDSKALSLAKTELSTGAQAYLSSVLPKGHSFKPEPTSAPDYNPVI
jgi:hypothetical protein